MALLLAAGCRGDDRRDPVATATPPVGANPVGGAASPASPFVGEVVWAREIDPATGAPVEAVERFAPEDPTIYAALQVARQPPGAELTATWTYNGVPLDPLTDSILLQTQNPEPIWVEFHLSRAEAEPWPAGTYAIEVGLNGQPLRSATVEVVEGG